MTEPTAPKGRLPETVPRRAVFPGQNSWAQQQQQERQHQQDLDICSNKSATPTNRDKYEHKPMPAPPPVDMNPSPGPYFLQPKAYVPPAVPLAPLQPSASINPKNRAVTDPITPKPLFTGRNISVRQARKRFSLSKSQDKSTTEGSAGEYQPSPDIKITPDMTVQDSGTGSVQKHDRNTERTLGVDVSNVELVRTADDTLREESRTPMQEVQPPPVPQRSTPIPTRRYLAENNMIPGAPAEDSTGPRQPPVGTNQYGGLESNKIELPKIANSFLHPARIGTHTNMGEVGLVDGPGMHRIESFRGVIEEAPISPGSKGHLSTDSSAHNFPSHARDGNGGGEILLPNTYSPNNFRGIWENDPAVGHTLPPFTPTTRAQPAIEDSRSRYTSPLTPSHPGTIPFAEGSYNYTDRFSNIQPALPSGNTWASNSSYGTSHMAPGGPPSAMMPPHWPHHQYTNSVPSPPHDRRDFQRAGSVSAALSHMDMTFHHHMDSSFGSLSRLVSDKHDRMMDQTIRRLDKLEELLTKGLGSLKGEVREIRRAIDNVQGDVKDTRGELRAAHVDVKDIRVVRDGLVEFTEMVNGKLEGLEKIMEEHAIKHEYSNAEQSVGDSETDHRYRSEGTSQSSQRRTESAHPTFGQGEIRQQERSQVNANGGRRNRSYTANSQRPSSTVSDERSNRRGYYIEMEAARGPAPDLRDHPAYAGSQRAQGEGLGHGHGPNAMSDVLSRLPFKVPSLTDGKWYEKAYGQHR